MIPARRRHTEALIVGDTFDDLMDPPPPVDDDSKTKILEAAKNDPTGQSVGGPGKDDLEKSEETCIRAHFLSGRLQS